MLSRRWRRVCDVDHSRADGRPHRGPMTSVQ